MGWSASARACYALDYIRDTISTPLGSSNALPGGRFYETGAEQRDGAITGTVWKPVGTTTCSYHDATPTRACSQCSGDEHTRGRVPLVRRAGSLRVEPDGVVTRFPGLNAATRAAAKIASDARYRELHGVN